MRSTRVTASSRLHFVSLALIVCALLAPGSARAQTVSPEPPECNKPASAIKQVTPAMPEIALRVGASGMVQIKVQIDATGKLVAASIFKSSLNAALDEAALDAARRSTYSAPVEDCKPVPGTFIFVVTYSQRGEPSGGFYRAMCSSINKLRGERLANGAAQLEYMSTVPTISDNKKLTTGLEERYAVATMLADDLMLNDNGIPYNGCLAIVSASPILKQMPDVQDEISRAMTLPDADTSLDTAVQEQYAILSRAPANKDASAKLGATPRITLIYRDRFSPLFGYDEIGVIRLDNGLPRSYLPYSRKNGQLTLGTGGQVCIQGDTRCAPLNPILP